MSTLTFALAKGRLAQQTVELLEKCGIDCTEIKDGGRKLILEDAGNGYRFLLVKPSDVPTYVDYGVADIGVAGKDTVMEANLPLYEMLDLGLGRCKLCIAGYPDSLKIPVTGSSLRVATKFPNIARRYYQSMGETIEVITLGGSVELGPMLKLSDVILDIVESGQTLKENGLVVLSEVCDISARIIVNRVSLKTKGAEIKPLIEKMKKTVGARV